MVVAALVLLRLLAEVPQIGAAAEECLDVTQTRKLRVPTMAGLFVVVAVVLAAAHPRLFTALGKAAAQRVL